MAYKIDNRKFFWTIIFCIASVFWLKPHASSALKIANFQEDSLHYNTFLFYRTKNIDSALYFARMSVDQARQNRDTELIIKSYNAVGYCFQRKQQLDSALYMYKTGLHISETAGNSLRAMYFSNSIGIVYDRSGLYDSALVYFYNALDLSKELEREKDEAIALTNIGNVNFDLGLKEPAISFYEQAIEIKERLQTSGLENTYYNIGLCYAELEEHEKSLSYFQKMIALCSSGNCSNSSLDRGRIGIGMSSWVLGELDESEQNFLLVTDSEDEDIRTVAFRYLSMINHKRGNYQLALSQIKQSNYYARRTVNKEALKTNYQHMGDVYKSLTQLDSALFYYDKHFALKDSLFNETVAGSIQDLFVKLERKQAQAEIDAKEKQLETQQIVVVLMSLVIILTAIVGWFIIRDLLKRKKQNIYLDKQVNLKTKQLQQSNAELKAKKNDLDNLIYKISHDIRGPLARLQGLIQVGRIEHGAGFYDKMEEQAKDLEKILNRMAVVNSITHHELKITDIQLHGFITDLIKKYTRQWDDEVEFNVNLGEHTIQSDPELLEISLYNILDNAVRFRVKGKGRSIIKIGYANKAIFVEDNGQGFDQKYINKITDLFFVANESSGTGIGLHHTSLAIQKLGAELKVASNASPTRFEIVFDS